MPARWALLKPFQILKDGSPHLDRLRLIETPYFGVFLHRIYRPDLDRDPHNHPWWFASVVLAGGYTELVWDHPEARQYGARPSRARVRKRGSLAQLHESQAHRITAIEGLLWTLVIVGPHRHSWGFWTHKGFVHWRDYIPHQRTEDQALWGSR
jgi:hypothetical protein